MKEESIDRIVGMIRRIEGHELMPHVVRLLAEGEPVPLERLAESAGVPVDDVRAMLARHPAVEWDAEGRLWASDSR